MKLLVIYGSSRKKGNTDSLTKLVLEQVKEDSYHEIYLSDYHILPVIDERHTVEGFHDVDDDYEELASMLMDHEAVLFVTPLYWYGMSGQMKNFIDRWTQSLRSKSYDFKERMKDKKMYVLIVGGSISPFTALPLVQQFQLISSFMKMDFRNYVIGKGVKPKEVLDDEESVIKAKQFGIEIQKDLLENE